MHDNSKVDLPELITAEKSNTGKKDAVFSASRSQYFAVLFPFISNLYVFTLDKSVRVSVD